MTDTEKRLAEATALLERLSEGWAENEAAEDLLRDVGDFLCANPSPPVEPAPSLVEQIEAAINKLEQWCSGPDELEQTRESALRILRAAREAGGR